MTEKMIVSWDEYNKTVEKLAIQIDESGYKPTILIGIMRGAAPMIDVLSRIFKLKCAYLAVESYSCLLYTSPSPRDKRQSRMPSSA